jgi:hypothetical protein
MSEQSSVGQTLQGVLRHRLLVNAMVDPDEAACRLPAGVRPHSIEGGTVVGHCLLEIGGLRAAWAAPVRVATLRAVAQRISVEWDDDSGATITGVYVLMRHTDSRMAAIVGGRWFPGVHRRARVDLSTSVDGLRCSVRPLEPGDHGGLVVGASTAGGATTGLVCEAVGATCLGASIGLSADRNGALEAASMVPQHRDAREVVIDELRSEFLESFSTATVASAYLMTDVPISWARTKVPTLAAVPV